MKCVILAGGLGSRISEETAIKPKPMVEIGGYPILWHIMKIYSSHGIDEFIICLGYKGHVIKEYFAHYFMNMSDVTFDMKDGHMQIHSDPGDSWKVTCVDTGKDTMTGGRIKRIREYIGDETFCLTYGDGVSDVDIKREIDFHKKGGSSATMAAVSPNGRFGHVRLEGSKVTGFAEKPETDGSVINGGFFVLGPEIFDLIEGDASVWERQPLEKLASEGRLSAWVHNGFWHPLDTLHDKHYLEDLWMSGKAPWKIW
jgi:glucose-1-phosphate cytidylyltransferase